ncbi:uncharacterized protein LOC111388263 [Olea europaea var. sylvestris]|uniref:uncharacterized protein LOC111388263 n=1 Tax=Olea europaea var. sylvestris TaxID=158386 RepID=UPI000C1D3182|nr:uncharacterized protein LOC111388263 [Olea europaea var. sylvestris]
MKPLKEVSEKYEKKMEEFLYGQNKSLEDLSNHVSSLISTKIGESIERNNPSPCCTAGLPAVEFPKFSGDGFDEWVYKCNELFDLYKTTDDVKVELASIHIDGKALQWHRVKIELSPVMKWEDYTHQMGLKFGAKIHGSGMENESRETNTTPLNNTKWPRRRICKLRGTSDEESPKLKESYPRFGPFYRNGKSSELYFRGRLGSIY